MTDEDDNKRRLDVVARQVLASLGTFRVLIRKDGAARHMTDEELIESTVAKLQLKAPERAE